MVSFGGPARHGKPQGMRAAPDSLIENFEAMRVSASDYLLELGSELKEGLTHEPSGDTVASSQVLNLRFSPTPAVFGFYGGHQSGAHQPREVGRMVFAL